MKIILADDVETLGHKGDLVSVADGYARNFLIPKGLAITATKGALKQAEMMQRARLEREEKAKAGAAAKVSVLAASRTRRNSPGFDGAEKGRFGAPFRGTPGMGSR